MSKLSYGKIPAGKHCPFSSKCKDYEVVCNGMGCPVHGERVTNIAFSCGLARFFDLWEKE